MYRYHCRACLLPLCSSDASQKADFRAGMADVDRVAQALKAAVT